MDFGNLVCFPMLDGFKLRIDKYKKIKTNSCEKIQRFAQMFFPFQNFNNSYIHNLDILF